VTWGNVAKRVGRLRESCAGGGGAKTVRFCAGIGRFWMKTGWFLNVFWWFFGSLAQAQRRQGMALHRVSATALLRSWCSRCELVVEVERKKVRRDAPYRTPQGKESGNSMLAQSGKHGTRPRLAETSHTNSRSTGATGRMKVTCVVDCSPSRSRAPIQRRPIVTDQSQMSCRVHQLLHYRDRDKT